MVSPVPALELRLLGDVSLSAAGRRVDAAALRRRAGTVVLARLALAAGEAVTREQLVEAVWDAAPPRSWPASLRNVISGLRGALTAAGLDGAAALPVVDGGYRLVLPDGVRVDALSVTAAVDEARAVLGGGEPEAARRVAEDALSVAARPLLGSTGGDWVERERGRFARIADELRLIAGRCALELGDPGRAEQLAHELVAGAPLREDGHRLLIRALRDAGNNGQALEAYDRCRRLLLEELGTLPAPETEALFHDLLAEGADARSPVAASLMLQRVAPFVGRAEQLEVLTQMLAETRRGGPRMVTLTAEAGAGKTQLAAQLAMRAADAGMTVLYGRADDRVGLPHGALLEAVTAYVAGRDAAEVERLLGPHGSALGPFLPRLGGGGPADPGTSLDVDQLRVAQAVDHALRAIAGDRGALVVLDDLQWAPEPTIDLLDRLVDGPVGAPLAIVAIRRAGDQRPRWGALARRHDVIELELAPLSEVEVRALAVALRVADDEVAGDAWRRSGGNALYATELLRAGRGSTRRLDELVRSRMAALRPQAQRALEAAAVAGLEFDPDVVAGAIDIASSEAARIVREAQQEGLLAPGTREGRLAFRHVLVRDSLLAALPERERLILHVRLGSQLEDAADESPSAQPVLAYHFTSAAALGDWRRAVQYALPVARAAVDAGFHRDAASLADRTLDALARAGDPDPAARLDLQTVLGAARCAMRDPAGHELLQRAVADARELGDPIREADAALAGTSAGDASDEAFTDAQLVETYERALTVVPDRERTRRALLLGRLATGRAWDTSSAEGLRAADAAVELARELGDPPTLARVLATKRNALSGSGLAAEQDRVEDELFGLAEELDDPGLRVRSLVWRFETRVTQGRGEELERLLDAAESGLPVVRIGRHRHMVAYHRAALALLRGDLDEADALVDDATRIGLEHGVAEMVVYGVRVIQLICVRAEQGRLAEIRDEVAATFAQAYVPGTRGATAYVDGELGRLDDARPSLADFFGGYADGPTMSVGVGLAALVALPVARVGDVAWAERLVAALSPFSGLGGHITNLTCPIDYALGMLAESFGRPEEAARRHERAVAFARGLGAPRWVERAEAARERVA